MKRVFPGVCAIVLLLEAAACGLGWKHGGGPLVLPASHSHFSRSRDAVPDDAAAAVARNVAPPRRVSLALPEGWNWVMRGDDFVATRDGVFLQNIVVERIHVGQSTQSAGAFPLAALSSKQWPVRTVTHLKKRFAPGMSAGSAAEVVLDSRRNDPAVAGLEVREIATRTVAGNPAFKLVFDFGLNVPARMPRYRSVCYGFLRKEWYYGIEYTAAARHYFGKDAETFESLVRSVALADD
jgi:predicted small lipoprotein YifL